MKCIEFEGIVSNDYREDGFDVDEETFKFITNREPCFESEEELHRVGLTDIFGTEGKKFKIKIEFEEVGKNEPK